MGYINEEKSNKKSSYFQKKGKKCRITFVFPKKGGKSKIAFIWLHVQEKKDMVNKNTFMHLTCVAYNRDELLFRKLLFWVWL